MEEKTKKNYSWLCPDCGKELEVYATDNPCKYCDESGKCIRESMDQNVCTEYDVAKCKCGFYELF